jgi:hypothetical protein
MILDCECWFIPGEREKLLPSRSKNTYEVAGGERERGRKGEFYWWVISANLH